MASRFKRWLIALLASVAVVALLTVLIKLVHPHGTARGLSVLYILGVVWVAVRYGPAFAFVSALLSALTFDYFFLAPQHHLEVASATGFETYVAYIATAFMAGLIASRLRRQAVDAARLAAEQESLRRIASLVARGASPAAVLDGMRDELDNRVGAETALLFRRDQATQASVVASAGVPVDHFAPADDACPVGLAALTRTVTFGSETSAGEYAAMFGAYGEAIAGLRAASGFSQPVMVGGRPWGFVVVAAHETQLPPSAGGRVGDYTDLLATAIDNAQTRAELKASRVRIITAADETRRRIERDLHDGAQQRLVSLALTVGAARASVPPGHDQLASDLSEVTDGLRSLLDEVREMARGLHPSILAEGGLAPALKALARRSAVPVELDTHLDHRLPPQTELTAYYVASELLTNVAKHARASGVQLRVRAGGDLLAMTIQDDGIGGADVTKGSGLVGVVDRVSANDGTVDVYSPVGGGTSVNIVLPIRRSDTELARHTAPDG